jgi:hypothetical protein
LIAVFVASLAAEAQENYDLKLQSFASAHIIAIYSMFSIFQQELCLKKS